MVNHAKQLAEFFPLNEVDWDNLKCQECGFQGKQKVKETEMLLDRNPDIYIIYTDYICIKCGHIIWEGV